LGDGGDTEWAKSLEESVGQIPGAFDKELQAKLLKVEDAKRTNTGLGGAALKKGPTATANGKRKMAGLAAPSASSNSKLSANARLVKWLEDEGDVYLSDASGWGQPPHPMAISTETVDEMTNESLGRGLLARRSINEEDALLQIPLSLCLTKISARKAMGKDVLGKDINEYLAIATQLIHEQFVMGKESFWRPYLDVLPEVDEVNPTFTWTDDDLNFLAGSPVVAATQSMQNKLRREYDALLGNPDTGLCALHPDRFPPQHFTYQHWQWAFTMLFSRAIRLRSTSSGETLALVPYADLINHSPYSSAYLDARASGDWLVKSGGEEVILYADRGYRRMEQIYISYGPKSNADLLLLYGFALERNPYNSVDVTVSIAPRTEKSVARRVAAEKKRRAEAGEDTDAPIPTPPVDPLAEEKTAFLSAVGRSDTVDFPCYADRYPTELLEYLRLMMMTPSDTGGLPLTAFDYSRTVSAANEAAVLYSIVDAVTRQLALYPNPEEQDAAIIKDATMFRFLSYNQRMAARHRRNEKRLLKRTIAALEKQIKSRGLDAAGLERAGGSTLGKVLPGEEKKYRVKQRTALEDRLEKMGLPVDLR